MMSTEKCPLMEANAQDRLLIIDDDVCFGAVMSAVASRQGFAVRFFPSLVDMGSFARIKQFDIAIIDYFLGHLRGDEIAEYVDTFFDDVPIVIVSGDTAIQCVERTWPASVRAFVSKGEGPLAIAQVARQVLSRDRWLKHLSRQTIDPYQDLGT